MKIIVLGVPHTQTTRVFNTCPFTMKAWVQCQMLHRRGHEVIHIGVGPKRGDRNGDKSALLKTCR